MALRIQEMSDLHVEFDRDGGDALLDELDESVADVLVIAGDLGMLEPARDFIYRVCAKYKRKKVIYVPGNHEYYGATYEAFMKMMDAAVMRLPNLVFLNRAEATITGPDGSDYRFLGCTLWYKDPGRYNWSDFKHIPHIKSWYHAEAHRCRIFLENNLRPGDIVVTHMLPSARVVAPKYIGNPDNCFFVHDLTPLILERKPALWIFGHTHDRIDLQLGSTRMVCRPRGYPFEKETTAAFDPNEVILFEHAAHAAPPPLPPALPEPDTTAEDTEPGTKLTP